VGGLGPGSPAPILNPTLVATALVSSRLDYANMPFQLNTSLVSNAHKMPMHVLSQLLALLTPAYPLHKRLHCLAIDARIKFKIATLIGNPPYLASLLLRHSI